eukprot:TRINITY_DN8697_c0_g1_i1.p1 TRINITY_DN8697_c0_g1~~TRINITY_DN8697_c0_g1_i1.p1  ORF type:complete len:132 (-),score=5.71 TRINITY_DN8697_c0_g1_i1:114-509(-)
MLNPLAKISLIETGNQRQDDIDDGGQNENGLGGRPNFKNLMEPVLLRMMVGQTQLCAKHRNDAVSVLVHCKLGIVASKVNKVLGDLPSFVGNLHSPVSPRQQVEQKHFPFRQHCALQRQSTRHHRSETFVP